MSTDPTHIASMDADRSPLAQRLQVIQRWWANATNAVRMVVAFLVCMVVYFLIIESSLDAYNRIATRADGKQSQIVQASSGGDALKKASTGVGLGVLHYGQVRFPGDPQSTPLEFNRVVTGILDRHQIANRTASTRTGSLRADSPLAKAISKDDKIDRIIQDLQFDATPEAAVAVIADLEREPIVANISRIQIRKDAGRGGQAGTVRVSMAVEAWVRVRKERGS